MSRWILVCTAALLPILFLACSKSGSGPAGPPPGPSGIAEQEPNDTTPQALGTLGSTDLVVNGSAAGSTDEDWYSVTLGSSANLHASVDWANGDLDLAMTDANGIVIAFRDTGAKPERCTLPARPAGTYRIRISSKTAGSVAYTLSIGPR